MAVLLSPIFSSKGNVFKDSCRKLLVNNHWDASMGMKIGTLLRAGILFAGISFGDPAHAIEVFSGEYLVEYAVPQGEGPSVAQSFVLPEVQSVRKIGAGVAVVKRGPVLNSLAFKAPSVESYSESHDLYCKELLKQAGVLRCSPNFKLTASSTPNDPSFARQWSLVGSYGVRAPDAWNVATDSSPIVVAVLDTGIDLTHPDLINNLWRNDHEIPGNGIDDDKNGYIDDIHGINTLSYSAGPNDDNGHGSHVAGTIAAEGDNSIGVTGIAWHAQLMALKFLGSNGAGSLAGAVEAINYAIEEKARGVNVRLINASWGGGGYSEILKEAIERASEAGIIVVVAAGNEANNNDANPSYPSSYKLPNVISVAAIGPRGDLASFSNRGRYSVHIGAPGVDILSTINGGRYASYSGTSMAAPHVSGGLSLLLAKEPSLTIADVTTRLMESGRDLPSLSNLTISGRVFDVSRLLTGERVRVGETQSCATGGCGASVSGLKITAAKRTRSAVRQANIGERITLTLSGVGSGVILVTPSFDSFTCGRRVPVEMKGGKAAVIVRIPKSASDSKRLLFSSSGVRRAVSLKATSRTGKSTLNARSSLDKACRELVTSTRTLEIN